MQLQAFATYNINVIKVYTQLRCLGRVIHCTLPSYVFPLLNFHSTPTSILQPACVNHVATECDITEEGLVNTSVGNIELQEKVIIFLLGIKYGNVELQEQQVIILFLYKTMGTKQRKETYICHLWEHLLQHRSHKAPHYIQWYHI